MPVCQYCLYGLYILYINSIIKTLTVTNVNSDSVKLLCCYTYEQQSSNCNFSTPINLLYYS